MSFFSIIVPTFNAAATIQNAINSIIIQSFTDFEIIVIDGLSTDNTIEILRAYNDPRVRIFSEKDSGIYDAMNKGIEHANGKWLYFMGSDDALYDDSVLATVAAFSSDEDCFAIYGNVKINGDAVWAKHDAIYDGEFDITKLLTKNICHQALFYRLETIKQNKVLFDMKYPVCSDWDFNLKCWSIGEFRYVNKIIAQFNAGGLSTRKVKDTFSEEIVQKVISYFNIHSFSKLKALIPEQKQYQLLAIRRYKWQNRFNKLFSKIS